jgi:predicted transposase YbfD/YdcC
MSVKALPEAWEARMGKRPLLAKIFVDPEGYKGTCYHASGWSREGRTKGYGRVSAPQYYEDNEHPKYLLLKPLAKDGVERLRDPSRLLPGEDPKARAPGAMPIKAKEADSLYRALRSVPDPRSRRNREFTLGAMLATTVLALCCNESTVSGIFRFCQDLSSQQRRSLGFRSKPAAPRVVPPPGEGCWRKVLGAVDPEGLATALNAWMQSQSAAGTLPSLLSIDGKVIGNNLATIVSLVDATDGSPVAQAAASGNGQEQKLTKQLVRELPQAALEGKTVCGDALYSNKNLVREIVQERGGEVLVQLKANQKTTLEEATRRLSWEAPPFLRTEPELSHGRIDIRSVRYLTVTPMKVNFPCIHSVAEIHRDSTVKKTKVRSLGQRIYLSSRPKEPSATILEKVRLRWNVENKNHHPRDATFLEDKCRCRTRNTAANLALLRGAVLMIWKKMLRSTSSGFYSKKSKKA